MDLFSIKTCDSLPACRLALVLSVKTGILGFFPQVGVTWYVYFCAIPPAEINFKVRQESLGATDSDTHLIKMGTHSMLTENVHVHFSFRSHLF